MSPHNKKRLKYYLLIISVSILINITPINAQEVSPSPEVTPTPTPTIEPTPSPTPSPENSQFYDTPTNIEAAVIIMNASKSWGIKIYPAIYCFQIIGILLRYV